MCKRAMQGCNSVNRLKGSHKRADREEEKGEEELLRLEGEAVEQPQ